MSVLILFIFNCNLLGVHGSKFRFRDYEAIVHCVLGCRLGGLVEVASAWRDGAHLISKLVQPLLHLIGDKDSNVSLVCKLRDSSVYEGMRLMG